MSTSVAQTVCYIEMVNGKLGTTEILLLCPSLSALFTAMLPLDSLASIGCAEKQPVWQLYHKIHGNSPVAAARPLGFLS